MLGLTGVERAMWLKRSIDMHEEEPITAICPVPSLCLQVWDGEHPTLYSSSRQYARILVPRPASVVV